MIRKLFLGPIALAALMAAGAAQATFTVYTSQTSFLAAINAPAVDYFRDLSTVIQPSTLTRTLGAYTYSANAGPRGLYALGAPASGAGGVSLSTEDRQDTLTLNNFSPTVRGVGANFFRTDYFGNLETDSEAVLTIIATDASGSFTQRLSGGWRTTFMGFVSNGPITSLSLVVGIPSATGLNLGTVGVWPTMAAVTLGVAPVPEPQTYLLMLGGLSLLGWAARQRRV